jgi:orotidine-5'-phosphate decarboxylase
MKEKVCLALDVDTYQEAESLSNRLCKWVGIFKVGSQLFTNEGKKVVHAIQQTGADVFLDLKYHDIPNTVASAAKVATRMGVYMFTVHALGGFNMMKEVAEKVREEAEKNNIRKPLILAITVLTSMSEEDLKSDLFVNVTLADYIKHLASLAYRAGLDGVVCSPKEIEIIRKACGDNFIIVTPGIRPSWSVTKDDQKRITTPKEAIKNGANYIVVGRPILKAENPEKAASMLLEGLEEIEEIQDEGND